MTNQISLVANSLRLSFTLLYTIPDASKKATKDKSHPTKNVVINPPTRQRRYVVGAETLKRFKSKRTILIKE